MASRSKVITVVGSVNADVIVEITRFPEPGETMAARKNDTGYVLPGGKGANQAVAAKKLGQDGVHVNFIGVFGNDGNAEMLRKVMKEQNVDISHSQNADVPNGQALIFLDASGENSIIIIGGSNQAWPEGPLPESITDAIKGSDVLLLQREIPDRINVAAAKTATEAGCVVISDVGGADTEFPPELLRLSTYVCPNETELARITGGTSSTDDEEVLAAARQLQKQGAQNVLVTLGSQGSMLVNKEGETVRVDTVSPPGDIKDTTGAGDVFRAAFGVGLAVGMPFELALRRAAAASAYCITKMGTIPAMPVAADVDELLSGKSDEREAGGKL